MLKIKALKVKTGDEKTGKEILKHLNLEIKEGEIHILMGPNGSGKSTLAFTVMGNPDFTVSEGTIEFNGKSLLTMSPEQRAREGIFLSFQYPSEIPGVSTAGFLRTVYNKSHTDTLSPHAFRKLLEQKAESLGISKDLVNRNLNEGFSGGEKKIMEVLQMMILEPKLAVFDEIDSGLDIDALKKVTKAINRQNKETGMAALIITHQTGILKHIEADKVHIMQDGKITQEGGKALAEKLEEKGFAAS